MAMIATNHHTTSSRTPARLGSSARCFTLNVAGRTFTKVVKLFAGRAASLRLLLQKETRKRKGN
jgi:hypothetical protein